ncbi:MAG: helix-turn-helix domain-containing protein [Haliea sp.]
MNDPTPRSDACNRRGLLTTKEAASELRITVEQFRALVHDGELAYVNVGRGKKRPRMMFTPQDLDDFIERRKRRDAPLETTKGQRMHNARRGKARVLSLRDAQIAERRERLFRGSSRTDN